MSDRTKQLKERLETLKQFQVTELKLKKPSRTYLSDLTDSIQSCERELAYLAKNPDGIEFINGQHL